MPAPVAGGDPALDAPPPLEDSYEAGQWFTAQAERMQAVADALPSMIWTGHEHRGVDYVSGRWEEFSGLPAAALMGLGIFDLVHPDDQPLTLEHLADATNVPETMRFRMRRHDGQWRWMEARVRVVGGEVGSRRVVGVTTDIDDQVGAQRQLARRNQQLDITLDLVRVGVFTWHFGPGGTPTGLTPDGRLSELMGMTADELDTGGDYSGWMEMIHPDDRALVGERIAAALQGENNGEYRAEYRYGRPGPDGPEERWFSALGRVTFGPDGGPLEMTGVLQDITERRRVELGRVRLQKLEATGTLAGGVAHDFGNLIGAILSTARVGQAEARAGLDTADTFEDIALAAGRARELVERLMSFARPQAPLQEPLDLPEIADEAIRLVRPTLGPKITVTRETLAQPPALLGDPGQIHQVLVNLLTNAGNAIDGHDGEISVIIDKVEPGDPDCARISEDDAGQRCARIRVRDNGSGMPTRVAARVFDPFFTTRVDHGGTGLGLAAVQSIINAHRGTIDVDSVLGEGTTFTVLLPADA